MNRNEVHILEYGAILAVLLAASYLSFNMTGFLISDGYMYMKEVNATSTEKKVNEKITFESFRPESCKDGILVLAGDSSVNFTTKKEKYKDGFCKKATVEFDNLIYSKADKKKNATKITYIIYYGKQSGDQSPDNETDDDYENQPPVLFLDIPNIVIEYNSSHSLNLMEYFSDNETLAFTADGNESISITISGSTATLTPASYPYNGTHTINAADGEYTTSSTFGVYANPSPVYNETPESPESVPELNMTLLYPENNSVMMEGNHTFVFAASGGECRILLRDDAVDSTSYIGKGYYRWGVSCDYMNRTYFSGKNYFVAMSPSLSLNYSRISNPSNASNISVETTSGKLMFDEPIDLTVVQEMERYINISANRVEIDTLSMQHLNKSAIITLYNIEASSPVIKQNGFACPADICQIISYENGVMVFRVKHFTVYEVGEAPPPEPEPQQSSGGSSGGSGNFVSSESSFGGPVIITKKTENTTAVPEKNETKEIVVEKPVMKQPEIETEEAPEVQIVQQPQNTITGSIVSIFRDSFIYIAMIFFVAVVGFLFAKKRKS